MATVEQPSPPDLGAPSGVGAISIVGVLSAARPTPRSGEV